MSYKKVRQVFKYVGIMTLSAVLGLALLTGCGKTKQSSSEATETSTESEVSIDDLFTERDLEQDYKDENVVNVTLADGESKADGSGVTISGDTITITQEGTYIFSGTLTNGQIIVDAAEDAKVEIVLDNANISTDSAAAIYAKSADKLFVTTTSDSSNALTSKAESETDDETTVDGVIFAKCDLTVKGKGSLTINGANNGIVTKDDLRITGSTIEITASNDAIQGKDSFAISDGNLTVSAEDDGVHSDEAVYVCGGKITVTKCYEGLEGQTITISDGDINITASDDGLNAAGGNDSSATAIKAGAMDNPFDSEEDAIITISGGTLTINASGDGIDSNGTIVFEGGTTYVSGPTNDGNTAIDYGISATMDGGTLIAAGSTGMVESFSDDSKQCIATVATSGGSGEIVLYDSEGNELASYTPDKNYECVTVSCADMEVDKTYSINAGGSKYDFTQSDTVYSDVSGGMGNGGPGGAQGNMQGAPDGSTDMQGTTDSNSTDGQKMQAPSDANGGNGQKMQPPTDANGTDGQKKGPQNGTPPNMQKNNQDSNSTESDTTESNTI